jgi:hypothetical protein
MKFIQQSFVKIMMATLLLIIVSTVNAAPVDPATAVKTNSIVFVKTEGDAVIFRTDLLTLPAGGSTLFIKDEAGNVLFSEVITTMTHQKLYRISRENISGLYFEVRSKKFSFKQSFNFQTKIEETFTVTKAM